MVTRDQIKELAIKLAKLSGHSNPEENDGVNPLWIYFAREAKDESISSEKLAEAITLTGDKAIA